VSATANPSTGHHGATTRPADDYRAKGAWASAWKKAAGVGAMGLVLSAVGAASDPRRFAFSYLFAFFVFLSIALGALFFVLVQHLTVAGWSVTVRRSSEFLMSGLPAFLVLAVPILVLATRLYPWAGAERLPDPVQAGAFANATDEGALEPLALSHANEGAVRTLVQICTREEAEATEWKKPYLLFPFFVARTAAYLLIWAWIGRRFLRWSTSQDRTKSNAETVASQRFAPAAMILFAVTVGLASFDWLMSLDPLWSSTAFGVYVFSGCVVAHAAALVLFTLWLRRSGPLHEAITVEHYHDLGKLLFGWLSFWAYIAFAQFFLTWYASLPHEVSFYHRRWDDNLGTWQTLSRSLFYAHFLVPFWLLISRHAKRNLRVLGFGAALILVMHAVETYWLILPNIGPLSVHWLDLTCLLGVGGAYFAVVLHTMEAHSLIPTGDPRLARSLAFENG
jgi:hypothetical protein